MNPALPREIYTPDVEAHVWEDGKIYMYGSNDIANNDAYCSYHHHVYASADMENWEIYKNAFYKDDLKEESGMRKPLFAPDCEYINGKYCIFFCTQGKGEGVAFSDTPYGPFTNEQYIKTANGDGIDPSVLVDGDDVYYLWGQGQLRGAKLNEKLDDIIPETYVCPLLTNSEDGFHEGSSIRKIGDLYYIVFADHSRDHRPTCLGYATSKNALGPYEKKGIIIDNIGCDPSSWNNHGSIQQLNGQWYVFYHRSSHNSYFSRRVCIEPIFINEDGTIDEVEMTSGGASGNLSPKQVFPAERFCLLSGNCNIQARENFDILTDIHNGDTATIKYIDFSKENVSEVKVLASTDGYPSKITFTLDSADGEVIAEVNVTRTASQFDYKEFTAKLSKEITGVHSVHATFTSEYQGKLLNFQSFELV